MTTGTPRSQELYPEAVMWSHLSNSRIPLRVLEGFNASLARGGDGEPVTFADPFGKLRFDFPRLSATLPLSPTPCFRR